MPMGQHLRWQQFEYVMPNSMFTQSRHSPGTEYKAACKRDPWLVSWNNTTQAPVIISPTILRQKLLETKPVKCLKATTKNFSVYANNNQSSVTASTICRIYIFNISSTWILTHQECASKNESKNQVYQIMHFGVENHIKYKEEEKHSNKLILPSGKMREGGFSFRLTP